MKREFFTLILICITITICKGQCEEFKSEIKRLINEKANLKKKLNKELIAYDRLDIKYRKEFEERLKYQNLYYSEVLKNAALKKKLIRLEDEYKLVKIERDKLAKKIAELEKDASNYKREYEEAILQKIKLDGQLDKLRKEREEDQKSLERKQTDMMKLADIIGRLRDESKDWISIKKKKIFFEGKEFTYGDEIIFVHFEKQSTNNMTIDSEDEYRIQRISKLASRYDFRVRLSLEGESTAGDYRERKKLAQGRVGKVKSTMILKYNLQEKDFGKTSYKKYRARIGVSVRIRKR